MSNSGEFLTANSEAMLIQYGCTNDPTLRQNSYFVSRDVLVPVTPCPPLVVTQKQIHEMDKPDGGWSLVNYSSQPYQLCPFAKMMIGKGC